MRLIWDERKRESNIAKHGLDFADLTLDFFNRSRIAAARDGRFVAVGEWDGALVIAVIFRPLGQEALSIISMRRASMKEGDQANGKAMAKFRDE